MNNKKFDPNDLIKASLGISENDNSNLDNDEDIDSYIAKLLTEEANKKRKNYDKLGPSGYLHEHIITQKTQQVDKKFLSNIINRTNRHNTRLDREDELRLNKSINSKDNRQSESNSNLSDSSRSLGSSSLRQGQRNSIRNNLILNHLSEKSRSKLKKGKK